MPAPVPFLRILARIVLGLPCLVWVSISWSQTALEPEAGGIEYKLQGEYTGKLETVSPYAAQIVAEGNGQFRAILFVGGFPGQGWNGKDRTELTGSLQVDKAVFTGGGNSVTVASDGLSLNGKTAAGELFTLNKTFRESPTLNIPSPPNGIILFDGKDLSAWKDGTASMDARNFFKPVGTSATSGAITKATFQTFTLHLEFRLPFMPTAIGQRRGNSGIYLQGRDELQILDSYGANLENGTDTMSAKRECGAFFEYFRPSINAAYPPLAWQTYDVEFTAAHYDPTGKILLAPPVVTVKWNGITVQDKRSLVYPTLLGDPVGATPGPLRFQAYGDPVFFRNIWITEEITGLKNKKQIPKTGQLGQGIRTRNWVLLDGRKIENKGITRMQILAN
jgi:hypothetical protein